MTKIPYDHISARVAAKFLGEFYVGAKVRTVVSGQIGIVTSAPVAEYVRVSFATGIVQSGLFWPAELELL